jgi:phospholipid/cholesterol/gamma-HCH transport system substrate-binding protein
MADGGSGSMRGNNTFETLLSAAVVVIALTFLVFMRLQTGTGSLTGYELNVRMKQVDSLAKGADVRISGVKVGSIAAMTLEPKSYLATLRLDIRSDIAIPKDSGFYVSPGTMSSGFLSITPGKSKDMIAPGDTIRAVR